MSRISVALGRLRRRIVLAYQLTCARDDARARGLQAPSGIWFCDCCREVWWEKASFDRHMGLRPA